MMKKIMVRVSFGHDVSCKKAILAGEDTPQDIKHLKLTKWQEHGKNCPTQSPMLPEQDATCLISVQKATTKYIDIISLLS